MVEAAWDDITGEELDATKVKAARALDMHHYDQLEVFDKVEIAECWAKTGRSPISTRSRWIDHGKGTKYQVGGAAVQKRRRGAGMVCGNTPAGNALNADFGSGNSGTQRNWIC